MYPLVPSQREHESTKARKPEKQKGRLDRSVFLYMEPKGCCEADFAQCDACRMWVSDLFLDEGPRCVLHGSKQQIMPFGSCGLFVIWPNGVQNSDVIEAHADELMSGLPASVTTKESGYVERKVRCENCRHFDKEDSDCELYEELNRRFPKLFNLQEKVHEHGCCNANTPK